MSDHLPQCWTQDMGGMKRASADSCAVCHAIKFAVADALHEYDKQTYERCAKHMRTARREALDAAMDAVAAMNDLQPSWWKAMFFGGRRARWWCQYGWDWGKRDALRVIDRLRDSHA